MCGLVGMAGDLSHSHRTKVMRDLLDVCQLRGRDSTGVVKVDNDLDYTWVKQVMTPNVLCESRIYQETIEKGDASVLIGHTRHKTLGDLTINSAHPFDVADKGICGVHNGTLRNYSHLKGHSHNKVDSEVLYNHLAETSPEETFSNIEGAWACVWWDANEKMLNFIRNDKRPLFFAWSKDGRQMFWASEDWMLGAVSRNQDFWADKSGQQIFELPVNQLWRFSIDPKANKQQNPITMKAIHKIEPKAIRTSSSHSYNYGGYGGYTGNYSRQGGEVADPFPKDRRNQAQTGGTKPKAGDQSTSSISNVAYLNRSAQSSVSSTGKSTPTSCTRNTASQQQQNILLCPTTNKEKPSEGSSKSVNRLTVRSTTTGVSFRTVAGMDYITDNRTKTEYPVDVFYDNIGGECSFCHTEIFEKEDVHSFIDKNRIICTKCAQPPVLENNYD